MTKGKVVFVVMKMYPVEVEGKLKEVGEVVEVCSSWECAEKTIQNNPDLPLKYSMHTIK